MKTIFSRAVLSGTTLTAKGGAVRANKRYALSSACKLTADYMRATSFTFQLRTEVPKPQWDECGLWG